MTSNNQSGIKAATVISLLAGIWLFFSPWVYRAESVHSAWNSWVFAILIILFSAIRLADIAQNRTSSVVNLFLGAWVFISPWVYGYVHTMDRFINTLCVGAIVFIVSVIATSTGQMTTTAPPPAHP
jgi:hypothetical protein